MRVWWLWFTLTLLGCATPTQSTAPTRLLVPLERSPSAGATFDFCAEPPPTQPLNLVNVAWLAFLSANEYSHAVVLGPTLRALGFSGSSDLDWESRARDLRRLREKESAIESEIQRALGKPELVELTRSLLPPSDSGAPESDATWGQCARRFVERGGLRGDSFPAAALQESLVGRVQDGAFVQFFSAGAVSSDGRRFVDSSTQVLFARHRDSPVAFLVFRGTEPSQPRDVGVDLKTWHANLADRGWPARWGRAHAGFADALDTIAPLLLEKLRELEDTQVELHVAGHSLGAALATLMTARLLRADAPRLELASLTTFGSPRVGDTAFAKALSESAAERGVRIVRVRNGADVVTTVPGVLMDYRHVGRLAWLSEGSIVLDPEPEPGRGFSVGDHDISGYGSAGEPVSGYYRRLADLARGGAHQDLVACPSQARGAPGGPP